MPYHIPTTYSLVSFRQRWATATLEMAALPLSLFAIFDSGAIATEKNSSELSLPLLLVHT